jgi:hypothetical protein
MGKKKHVSSSSEVEESEQMYDSEDLEDGEELEDEMDSQEAPEVDRNHILNYESDSSEPEGNEDSLDEKLEK